MEIGESFVKLCGEVGNLSEANTGVSIVDAFFGPEELSPAQQAKDRRPEDLLHDLDDLADMLQNDTDQSLRAKCLLGEVDSLATVVKWMRGDEISYVDLVEQVFGIKAKRFSESEVMSAMKDVEVAFSDYPGEDTKSRVDNFNQDGLIQGDEARIFIEGELQENAKHIGDLFRRKIYDIMGVSVTDNGVEYKAVTDKPWGGYNYYQGNFKSLNEFNVDRPLSRHFIDAVIYHEYEHHVSNLWREKAYRDNNWVDLSVIPLTARCVISEGTADTAMDFLNVGEGTDDARRFRALSTLSRMCTMNAALMLNHEGSSIDDVIDYLVERTYREEERVRSSLDFIKPKTKDGKPNIWAPYYFNYLIGRRDFVYPTFLRARENGVLPEFFRTVYLNPYSGSSRTWNEAFEWL